MRLFRTVTALRCYLNRCRSQTPLTQVGFVPTMGSLHPGHFSLIDQAQRQNTVVVVSIFVNPLQFTPQEDFQQYPRILEQDVEKCHKAGVDVVFAPEIEDILTTSLTRSTLALQDQTRVQPPAAMTSVLCGAHRPGHFTGVTTIVTKLFNIVQPERAYFGQKDAQQLAIIRRMVADLNWPIEIVAVSTVREPSGLAYSSRNQYLTPTEKQQAAVLYRALQYGKQVFGAGENSSTGIKTAVEAELVKTPALELEYVELVDPDTLMPLDRVTEVGLLAIAAKVGKIRLIDNLILRNRQPILAIDGPAGAGKSTVTRQLAQALGLFYLDTGAMYRAVTWLVMNSDIAVEDEAGVAELVSACQIELIPQADQLSVFVNGRDVTSEIRSREVTANVSAIAAQAAVRQRLVQQQQAYGRKGGVIAEGRDIGTHVFPDAELKIFLNASVQARSQRRRLELQQQGQADLSLEQMEQEIALRDQKDSTRAIAPLRQAPDAIEIQTDNLSIDQVREQIIDLYHQKIKPSA